MAEGVIVDVEDELRVDKDVKTLMKKRKLTGELKEIYVA